MVQKLSIDPNIIDNKILNNSLSKINMSFQNLIEVKKMENPTIFLNNLIKDKLIKNISNLKILLNDKISEGEDYKKLFNICYKVEIHLNGLLNSPEKIYKINKNEFTNIEFKKYILKLYNKFGDSFLDFILVNSKIHSGFKEIDQSLSNYLENKSETKREYNLKKNINNFNDFQKKILNKLGINGSEQNERIFFINPGILNKIELNNKNYFDLVTTIKCICCYFYKKINDYKYRPKIMIITDNANYVGKNTHHLRKKILKDFEDLEKYVSTDFIILNRWEKKSQSEQRFIFSSNEVGYALNIDLDFLAQGKFGTKNNDFKILKDNFNQFKVVKHGIIKEITNHNYIRFLLENIINKANNNENSLKNPAFREIFEKLNIG